MGKQYRIPRTIIRQLRDGGIDPQDVVLYINTACNLRCRHCYVGTAQLSAGIEFNADDILAILQELGSISRLTLLGGEPLLHTRFEQILVAALETPAHERRLTSNLTMLGRLPVETIGTLPITICVSLDGYDRRSHDFLRGSGAFERSICNVRILLAHGADVEITHTVTARTAESIEEMISLCTTLGVRKLNLHRVTMHGNAADHAELYVPSEMWRTVVATLQRVGVAGNANGGRLRVRYPPLYVEPQEYAELVKAGQYHHHVEGSYYGPGSRIAIGFDRKVYISSEAFGTDAHIGSFDDFAFRFNATASSELKRFRNSAFRGDTGALHAPQTDTSGRFIALSVSYKRAVYI